MISSGLLVASAATIALPAGIASRRHGFLLHLVEPAGPDGRQPARLDIDGLVDEALNAGS